MKLASRPQAGIKLRRFEQAVKHTLEVVQLNDLIGFAGTFLKCNAPPMALFRNLDDAGGPFAVAIDVTRSQLQH
jgi:hypothetical protein